MQSVDSKLEQEETLLKYIDIPYFRNNPAYIDRWRKYYQRYRDPQILLLMYHKQVSTYFHWIYLELSAHFLRIQQPEMAHFILNEAQRAKVYDEARVRRALAEIPKFERKCSRGDLLALLNQRNINALGRLWNSFEEEFVYEQYLPQDFPNFELMKLRHYESKYGVVCGVPEEFDINSSMVEVPETGFFLRTLVNGNFVERVCGTSQNADVKIEGQGSDCGNFHVAHEHTSRESQVVSMLCQDARRSAEGDSSPSILGSTKIREATENCDNLEGNGLKHIVDGVDTQEQLKILSDPSKGCARVGVVATDGVLCGGLPKWSVEKHVEAHIQSDYKDKLADENLKTHLDGRAPGLDLHSVDKDSNGGDENSEFCVCYSVVSDAHDDAVGLAENSCIPQDVKVKEDGSLDGCAMHLSLIDENAPEPDCIRTANLSSEIDRFGIIPNSEEDSPDQGYLERPDTTLVESDLKSSLEEKICSSQLGLSSSFVGTQEIDDQGADPETRTKRSKTGLHNSFGDMFEPDFLQVSGDLAHNSEIIIGRYIYLVQEVETNGFSLLRIARDLDITQTMIGKYYLLRKTTRQNAKISRELFNCECCEHGESYFVLYEHSRIAHLSPIILGSSPIVCLFYLRKVVEKLLNLRENGLVYLNPENFFVDQNFDVVFNSFEFVPVCEESLHRTELELQRVFRNMEARISYEFLSLIDARLDLGSSKKDILKHKTELLEDF